jgi:hypothetical protein
LQQRNFLPEAAELSIFASKATVHFVASIPDRIRALVAIMIATPLQRLMNVAIARWTNVSPSAVDMNIPVHQMINQKSPSAACA